MQRIEQDLGPVAGVTDRGRRRPRNEDALALAVVGDGTVAVVCDGVASTSGAEQASEVAAATALHTLEGALAQPPADLEGWRRLFLEACEAARAELGGVTPLDLSFDEEPSTTLVAAVAVPGQVALANLGDSRAYWVGASLAEARQLTVDHSWAEERIAEGVAPEVARADPDASTITRWLSAHVESVEPTVTVLVDVDPGWIVVCTDGLSGYLGQAEALTGLLAGAAGQGPLAMARSLVDAALRAGGHDNVTVAVVPVVPRPSPNPPTEE